MALGGTDFKLRSDTERDTYNEVKVTTSAGITAGYMDDLEDIVGVYVNTSTSGNDNVLVYEASKIVVPCVAITTGVLADYTVGSIIYFDDTNDEVTAIAMGNTACGIVVEAGAIGDDEIMIHLMGALAL